MNKLSIGFILFLLCQIAQSTPAGYKKKLIHVMYYKNMFGHIHKNPSRYSQSLSTIGCGHPIKVFQLVPVKGGKGEDLFKRRFRYVKVGPYEGYVEKAYLGSKKPECFQDRFPRFFDHLELSLTDMYYWGKLYDQYINGKSRIR